MAKFKVQPVNIRTGATAPYQVIEAVEDKFAIQEAKQNSRLADFTNWRFYTEKIK